MVRKVKDHDRDGRALHVDPTAAKVLLVYVNEEK